MRAVIIYLCHLYYNILANDDIMIVYQYQVLFVCLVSGPALVSVSCDGADVEEVLTVLTQGVLGRLVTGLEVSGQRGSVWAQQLTEVTPTSFPVHRS